METLIRNGIGLSVVDRKSGKGPFCLLTPEDLLERMDCSLYSLAELDNLSGDKIRRLVTAHLLSALNKLNSTSDPDLGIERFTISPYTPPSFDISLGSDKEPASQLQELTDNPAAVNDEQPALKRSARLQIKRKQAQIEDTKTGAKSLTKTARKGSSYAAEKPTINPGTKSVATNKDNRKENKKLGSADTKRSSKTVKKDGTKTVGNEDSNAMIKDTAKTNENARRETIKTVSENEVRVVEKDTSVKSKDQSPQKGRSPLKARSCVITKSANGTKIEIIKHIDSGSLMYTWPAKSTKSSADSVIGSQEQFPKLFKSSGDRVLLLSEDGEKSTKSCDESVSANDEQTAKSAKSLGDQVIMIPEKPQKSTECSDEGATRSEQQAESTEPSRVSSILTSHTEGVGSSTCGNTTKISHSTSPQKHTLNKNTHATKGTDNEIDQTDRLNNTATDNPEDTEKAILKQKSKFVCHVCNKKLYSKQSLRNHLLQHSEGPAFRCKECSRRFPNQEKLTEHMAVRQGSCRSGPKPKKTKCTICKRIVSDIESHMSLNCGTDRYIYVCTVCGKKFLHESTLKYHMYTHTGEKPFSCKVCEKKFQTKSRLGYHEKFESCLFIPNDQDPTGIKLGECGICGKRMQRRVLKQHMLMIHEGKSVFKCKKCYQKYSSEEKLEKHMKSHEDEEIPPCELCNKVLTNRKAYKQHMRAHNSAEPRVSCQVCGRQISRKHLKWHELTHTSVKPYECEFCGKCFRMKTMLNTHKLIHTSETPYVCEFCGKSFNVSIYYKKHLEYHTKQKGHTCDICGKSFWLLSRLEGHKRTHTGERPFHCSLCGSKYVAKYLLLKHMRVKHKGVRIHELAPEQSVEELLQNLIQAGENCSFVVETQIPGVTMVAEDLTIADATISKGQVAVDNMIAADITVPTITDDTSVATDITYNH